jgi:hypothetical protein
LLVVRKEGTAESRPSFPNRVMTPNFILPGALTWQ